MKDIHTLCLKILASQSLKKKGVSRMSDLKILVVEDSEIVALAIKNMLHYLGYNADFVPDAEQALKLINLSYYDLILTDIGLPGMNGAELIAKIRKHESRYWFKSAYIYALSSYDSMDVKKDCFNAGANNIFNKPLRPIKLLQIIQKAELYCCAYLKTG